MRASLSCALLSTFVLSAPVLLQAQAVRQTATTIVAAPVFASPDDRQPALRVAREGSVLLLLDVTGEWCHIEFEDPQYGRRAGYVQAKFVRIESTSAPPSNTRENSPIESSPRRQPQVEAAIQKSSTAG